MTFRHGGEEKAWHYLKQNGHRLLAHNYRTPDRRTEIDLITLLDNVIHFIEVKEWRSGNPALSQNRKRQAMVRRAAQIFLASEDFRRAMIAILESSEPDEADDSSQRDSAEALCLESLNAPLDSGTYSVSFDLISIRKNGLEHIERIF